MRNGAWLARKRASPVGSDRAGHCHGSGRRRPAGLGDGHRGAPSGLAGISDGPSGARGTTSRAAQIAEPLARAWRRGFDQSRTGFAAVDGFPAKIAVRRALEQTAAAPVTGGSRGVRHGYRTGASRGDRRCGTASAPAPERRRAFQDTRVLSASQQGRHSKSDSWALNDLAGSTLSPAFRECSDPAGWKHEGERHWDHTWSSCAPLCTGRTEPRSIPGCGEMVRAPPQISTSQIRALRKSTYRYWAALRRNGDSCGDTKDLS